MQMAWQIILAVLWIAVLITIVVGIYYGLSLLLLAALSRIFPLTGRRQRPPHER
jgi:predicted secreted protein